MRLQEGLDRCDELGHRAEGASAHRLVGELPEPALSQANAKLVYRTVLTVDDPRGARHVVPLKLRKAVNPLYRRVDSV